MLSDSDRNFPKIVDIQKCECVWTIQRSMMDKSIIISSAMSAKNDEDLRWHLIFTLRFCSLPNRQGMSLVAAGPHIIPLRAEIGGKLVLCFKSNTIEKYTITKTFLLTEKSPSDLGNRVVLTDYIPREQFNDDFTVKCEISYFYLLNSIEPIISYVQADPLSDFGKLYLNEENSDVTICIKSKDAKPKEYPAHKLVLIVRSKVFEAMFKHDMAENKLNRVEVEDIKEEVFLEALRYVYTGQVENLDALVYDLLPVADQYELGILKITCENVLRQKLSDKTAMEIAMLADMFNCGDLKSAAIQFIKDHSVDVRKNMDTEAWNDLMSRPHLMKDLLMAKMG